MNKQKKTQPKIVKGVENVIFIILVSSNVLFKPYTRGF